MTKAKEDPADYVLERLHKLEDINFTRTQNAGAWKALLHEQDYVAREYVLGKAKITSSEVNRLVVFALRARDKPELVSSVELLIRESWRFHKNEDGLVKKTEILSGCIGGVYTYPEYRGKGLATIMVDKLVETAKKPEFLGENGFIFLYSEVGEYYTRNGFKSFGVPLLKMPLASSTTIFGAPDGVSLVKYHDFDSLFKTYNLHFAAEMETKVAADGIERISVNPTSAYIDWFHLRVKFFSSKLFGDSGLQLDAWNDSYEQLVEKFSTIEPTYFGLRWDCPKSGSLIGFIVWTYDYSFDEEKQKFSNTSTVLKIFVNTPEFEYDSHALQLIEFMKKYLESKHDVAPMSNFGTVVVWESEISSHVHKQLVKQHNGVPGLVNSSRSAIMFNNAEDDVKLKEGSIVWENNNKLPWF